MKYLVTPAPHKLSRTSTNDMYFTLCCALIPFVLLGMVNSATKVAVILVVTIATCVITEVLCCSIKNNKFMLADSSCFVTSLIITCTMPVNAPWYACLVAGIIAIGSKYLFGGLGSNLFNPSALARSVVGCLIAGFSFDLFENSTMQQILTSGYSNLKLEDLLLGNNVGGAIGTTLILGIMLVAVYLMVFRYIRWENILFSVVGFSIVVAMTLGAGYILPLGMTGSFLFVSVFMISDPTTSPYGFSARCIYALIFGLLAGVMMSFNIMGESAVFLALLLANFISPALDRIMVSFHKGVKKND